MTIAPRTGTVLIIVAGLSALLLSLALAFIARMRTDAEETQVIIMEAQAHIMLQAGCNYVQECSRMGWDRYWQDIKNDGDNGPETPIHNTLNVHEETFGWIDVRDGAIGPRTQDPDPNQPGEPFHRCYKIPSDSGYLAEDGNGDGVKDRPAWPAIGSVARCPMYVMERTPYATQLTAAYNPIAGPGSADFGFPYTINPDPQPVVANGWTTPQAPNTVTATGWKDFITGDQRPRTQSANRAWFRAWRDGPSTFVITCGAGGSQGFRDWNEVRGLGATAIFNDDASLFATLISNELRMWFRIEWSAAVMELTYQNLYHLEAKNFDSYMIWPMNATHSYEGVGYTQSHAKNQAGTIQWVQRLRMEPTNW